MIFTLTQNVLIFYVFIFIFPNVFPIRFKILPNYLLNCICFGVSFTENQSKKYTAHTHKPLPPISAKKEMLSRISGTACRTGVRKYISRSYCSFHYVLTKIPASYCFPAISSIYSKSRLNFSSCSSILRLSPLR